MAHDPLVDVAWQLYDLPPAEFTAARNGRAAELRDEDAELARRVSRLRRASVPAWVVGQLVRQRGEQIAHLLQLADRLRAAQEDRDGASLSQLAADRRRLTTTLAHDGAELAADRGVRLAGAALDQVAQTLQAAMADADAAEAVASGRLIRALQAVGFDAVDLDNAVGGPPPQAATRPPPRDDLAERRARRAALAEREAEKRLAAAAREARSASDSHRDTADRLEEQRRRRDRAAKDLDAALAAIGRLETELETRRREAEEKESSRRAAESALDMLR